MSFQRILIFLLNKLKTKNFFVSKNPKNNFLKIFIAKENLFGNNASEITKRTLRKYDEYEISYEIFGVKNKLEGKGLLEFRPKYCMWAINGSHTHNVCLRQG